MKKKLISGITFFILISSVFGQGSNNYSDFNQYRRWGFVTSLTSYDKATISPQYGKYSFDNNRTLGLKIGFEYDFRPEKQWSFQIGMNVTKEAAFNVFVEIPQEDLFVDYGDMSDKMRRRGAYSLSVPLSISLKKQLSNRLYGHLIGGLKLLYYKTGSVSASVTYSNEDEVRQVFGMRLHTQESEYIGGFILGTGVLWTAKKFLLKTNLLYVMNFQPIMVGEYQFGNLEVSEPTRGDYTLSGNYLALSFTIHINKPKDKWE